MSVVNRLKELGIVDPTDRQIRERKAAPNLVDLRGKRLGLLENKKDNANLLLQRIGDQLKERYGLAEVIYKAKFIFSMVADPHILDELADRCDFVITAIAD
jgi:hypothetical protein